jgi:hypothetical protein
MDVCAALLVPKSPWQPASERAADHRETNRS